MASGIKKSKAPKKEKGLIARVGNTRTGYWEILQR